MSASVTNLPVISIERQRDPSIAVRIVLPRERAMVLQRLADEKFNGDLRRCIGELLEACASAVEEGQ